MANRISHQATCWGINDYGQAYPPSATFTCKQVSTGAKYTCGVKSNGVFTCWGDNTHGQLLAYKTFAPLIMK